MTTQELIDLWKQNAKFNRKEADRLEQEAALNRGYADILESCVQQLEKVLNDKK